MGLVLLVVATAFIFGGAAVLNCWVRPARVGEALLNVLALGCAAVMLETLVVGALLQRYRPLPLVLGAATFAALSALFARRAGLSMARGFRLDAAAARRAVRQGRRHPLLLLLALLALVVFAVRAWLAARLPPIEFDGLMYHLIGPDRWVQTGRVGASPENVWVGSYPLGAESLAAWPMVFLRTAQYASLALLPTYLLGAVAIFCLARALQVRASHATLAALIFLLTPAVFTEAGTTYVDVSAAAFGLAALALTSHLPTAVRLAPDPGRVLLCRLVMIGIVLGAAVAAKSSNLAVAGLITVAVAYRLYRLVRDGVLLPRRVLYGSAAAMFVPAFAIGGYWYLRTWVKYGNPLYPVSMLGFPGLGSVQQVVIGTNTPARIQGENPILQSLTSWGAAFGLHGRAITYDERLGGLGMAWPLFVLPAALIGVVLWHRSARRRGSGYLLVLAAVTVFASSPAAWWGRYVLAGLGALLPLAAYALTRLAELRPWPARATRRLIAVGLTGCLALTAWWGHQYLDYTVSGDPQSEQAASAAQGLPLDQALQLTTDPDRAIKVQPWQYFKSMDLVPDGSRVSLVVVRDQAILQPLIGLDLQRRLVMLATPHSPTRLAGEMVKAHAGYVMIDDLPQLEPLIVQTAHDPNRFSQLAVFPGRGVLFKLRAKAAALTG